MKFASLLAAAAMVLLANGFALMHAWRNRSGPVQAEITLTEHELPLAYRSSDEDSGVALNLRWMDRAWPLFGPEWPAPGLDRHTLHELGFDTSVPPTDPKAAEFYRRQRARQAFVALEYDGPAWRRHIEQAGREKPAGAPLLPPNSPPHSHEGETHLLAVDADTDAARLRARHPDRHSVILLPAVVRIWLRTFYSADPASPPRPAELSGSIQEIPFSIHVPRPFSDGFRRLPADRRNVSYRVHLRYGARLEPWVVGVEFPAPAAR